MSHRNPIQLESLEGRCLMTVAVPTATVPTHAKSNGLTVFANHNASPLFGSQVETRIAINPRNQNNIVVVSENQANSGSTILISRSFDGGKSWSPSTFGRAQDKNTFGNNRPDARVVFDSFGNCYVCYM